MPCRIYKLDFQEKNLNLESPAWAGVGTWIAQWLVNWRSVVQIPVQVQIFLLKI